jgi:hypothetical protein
MNINIAFKKRSSSFSLSLLAFVLLWNYNCFCNMPVKQSYPVLLTSTVQRSPVVGSQYSVTSASPLDKLCIYGANGSFIKITDGNGRKYFTATVQYSVPFIVGGSLGTHTITVYDKQGNETARLNFTVEAKTEVSDGGRYESLFNILLSGMKGRKGEGVGTAIYKDQTYHWFVPWGLDNYNTHKGMQYFSSYGSELNELFKKVQREDGMIWSFVRNESTPGYFLTAYEKYGYAKSDGKTLFVRQPVENHPEYLYVNTIYMLWKANGNDLWLKSFLSSASRALDYTINDSARWSSKYQLLKRVYTIDSWDFQIDDEYTPKLGVGNAMLIDAKKSKFGIFYGDNTGYAEACENLAQMFDHFGMIPEATKYHNRGKEIWARINKLSWNGRFYTHYVNEDENLKRNLGVDEKSQISLSNMYSLNRGLPHDKSVSIIKTYLELKDHLPVGSPAEWYAIYPPFKKGFGSHNEMWQYMNGGIAGHAAGELARGAFENGFETYGSDILLRLHDLAKKYEGSVLFAYTGSVPPAPSAPNFRPVDISKYASMDLLDKGSKEAKTWMGLNEPGNDLRNLPTGLQIFDGIKFFVIDPAQNKRKSVVAVSSMPSFIPKVVVPVNDTATAIYLLHAANNMGPEGIAGSITFEYIDGSLNTIYIMNGKQISGWWFPELNKDKSGVAWAGASPVSYRVGAFWTSLDNPYPAKKIKNLVIHAAQGKAIYAILGISLADKPRYVAPKIPSFGGPDNWANATAMYALIEGQAGIKDEEVVYNRVKVSPRWTAAGIDSVNVTARYAASNGYAAYQYLHNKSSKVIKLVFTGSGNKADFHVLLPEGIATVKEVKSGNQHVPFTISKIEQSVYVDFPIDMPVPTEILIQY